MIENIVYGIAIIFFILLILSFLIEWVYSPWKKYIQKKNLDKKFKAQDVSKLNESRELEISKKQESLIQLSSAREKENEAKRLEKLTRILNNSRENEGYKLGFFQSEKEELNDTSAAASSIKKRFVSPRDSLKQQQDEEFERSLTEDKKKEELNNQTSKELKKETSSIIEKLPVPEEPSSNNQSTFHLSITWNGKRLNRRFHEDNLLQSVFNYIQNEYQPKKPFQLVYFPRIILSKEQLSKPLVELKIERRASLLLEEIDELKED